MPYTAGIDSGSRAIKAVIIDTETHQIMGKGLVDQGVDQQQLSEQALEIALREAGLTKVDLSFCIATGYGRNNIPLANKTITEITCHAAGIHDLFPTAKTIIDIGGQDSKVIILEDDGTVRDFTMNDRCAAGTGRFLEIVIERIHSEMDQLPQLIKSSVNPAVISSMCVVFAETEIIGLLAGGKPPAEILTGVQNSIATRIGTMIGRNLATPIIFTGGVAKVPGMKQAIETALKNPVEIADICQFTGAYGAALLAAKRAKK